MGDHFNLEEEENLIPEDDNQSFEEEDNLENERIMPVFNEQDYNRFKNIVSQLRSDCGEKELKLNHIYGKVKLKLVGDALVITVNYDTLDNALAGLDEEYTRLRKADDIMRELERIKMGKNEDVASYYRAFQDLSTKYFNRIRTESPELTATDGYEKFMQPTLIKIFINGLKAEYSHHLRLYKLATLDQANKEALGEEAHYLKFGNKQEAQINILEQLLAKLEVQENNKKTLNLAESSEMVRKGNLCEICESKGHSTAQCRRTPKNISWTGCGKRGHFRRFCNNQKSKR